MEGQTQTESTSAPNTNRRKKNIIIAAIVAVVVLVVGGIIIGALLSNNEDGDENGITLGLSNDDYGKIYRSVSGLSFRIPEDWQVDVLDGGSHNNGFEYGTRVRLTSASGYIMDFLDMIEAVPESYFACPDNAPMEEIRAGILGPTGLWGVNVVSVGEDGRPHLSTISDMLLFSPCAEQTIAGGAFLNQEIVPGMTGAASFGFFVVGIDAERPQLSDDEFGSAVDILRSVSLINPIEIPDLNINPNFDFDMLD